MAIKCKKELFTLLQRRLYVYRKERMLLHVAYSGLSRCHCTIVCRGFEIMSCQCLASDGPEPFLPV